MRAQILGLLWGAQLLSLGCTFPDIQFSAASGSGDGGSAGTTGSGGAAGCCDCDGDKHAAPGDVCGGDDCDDNDKKVYPGEPTYYTEASPGSAGFNYDCSADGPTKDPSQDIGITCSDFALNQTTCEGAGPGYLDDKVPACGQPGMWGKCKWNSPALGLCGNDPVDPGRVMGCK